MLNIEIKKYIKTDYPQVVSANPEILNILLSTRVFIAVKKRRVRNTWIGGFISP